MSQMLRDERDQYEAELRGLSKGNHLRMEDMRDRAENLRSAREEKRKNLAEEKLYEHWRQNNPDLRKIESEMMKDHVIEGWSGQVGEKKERLESARKEKEEYERQLEKERLEAMAMDRQRMEEKVAEEKKFKDMLKEQMVELKAREIEAEMLKKEQEELEREQWEMEDLEEQRKQMEEQRKKQDFGRVLLRQQKAQMRRRSKQIQEELELDRKILEALAEKEAEQAEVQTARREKARADASWMKKVVEDQIRVEKAREAELDILYQEEAARMWEKREADWEKERRARERLMKEVLGARNQQIETRMEEVRERQEESLRHREQLLREMEIANQLTKRDQEKAEAEKEELKLELIEQATARRQREESARKRVQEEYDEQTKEEKEYEDFLRQETERMRLRGFTPRHHGKQAWT